MAFQIAEARDSVKGLPEEAFLHNPSDKSADWVLFVTTVDENPREKHDILFYAIVARVMAELCGSISPSDYNDEYMRTMIISSIKPGAKPFAGEDTPWKDYALTPAHVACALRVQKKSTQAMPSSSSLSGDNHGLTKVPRFFAHVGMLGLSKPYPVRFAVLVLRVEQLRTRLK